MKTRNNDRIASDDRAKTQTPALGRRRFLALGIGAAGAAAVATRSTAQVEHPYNPFPPPAPPKPAPPRAVPAAPVAAPRHPPAGFHPVLFWNDVAVQLDALDHSVDAKDARAPGPCAAARAIGLAHIVMADAAAAVYPGEFEAFCVQGGHYPENEYADVFIGAATARMLEHIYTTPAHTHLIGSHRQHFLKHYGPRALEAWNAGLAFGRNEKFTAQWHWNTIRSAALDSGSRGKFLRRGEHDVDPFNPDQKFYGVNWGQIPPLSVGLPMAPFVSGEPPREHDAEYKRDWEEVREIGAHRPEGPTAEQVKVGLFWGYDGARLIGTPPRLYNQIVAQIVEVDGMSVPEMARTFALCNMAMADAGIACWAGKYRYQVWRPVIGIPHAFDHPDHDWRPFGAARTNPVQFVLGPDARRLTALSMLGGGEINGLGEPAKDALPYHRACFTPNFPSYPSGHSTFGSACFNMLKRLRGERAATRGDPGRIDRAGPFVSDEVNGISIDNFRNVARPYMPVRYSRLEQMIEDNNKSRVHLGVHWNFDCDAGAESGARIAEAVYHHAYRKLS
jgi:hypothetical protein